MMRTLLDSRVGTTVLSAILVVVYVGAMVVNGLVAEGIGVPLTNEELASAHPVYLLPTGATFAVWGVIYLLLGVYTILQAIPLFASMDVFVNTRHYAIFALLANVGWLYLFANERFWTALVVIAAYLAALFAGIRNADVDVGAFEKSRAYALGVLVRAAFGANAAWVCVATALQFEVNLLEEGYYASADLSVGVLVVLAGIAAWFAATRTDLVYAAISAWALGGIAANQAPSSSWGCLRDICRTCDAGMQRICAEPGPAPLGWKDACDQSADVVMSSCPVEKSTVLVVACYVLIAVVGAAAIAGIVRGVLKLTGVLASMHDAIEGTRASATTDSGDAGDDKTAQPA
eukprot:CAMPEP_0206007760 /NCGR_PEP_ID=MMETSP1464-20131121/6100_1 /ASSEMBLY_ACC=CAM_ASM_001124 /TAXON_ID=119497 /ORGANISM="Exanthemachrysis gayraliae, Strain RCC1523" /LENGTH=345 /DNA_ID=CAMNT_0053381263 /DNA_START=20 /DNA_END=1057 /DNA_ORIENTATION=-